MKLKIKIITALGLVTSSTKFVSQSSALFQSEYYKRERPNITTKITHLYIIFVRPSLMDHIMV